jgi:hypothetical protein
MISCSLSKFFFNLPKIEGGFYTCQTAGPLTQRGAVETADGLVFLGIPVNARAMSVGRGPARFRRASRSAEGRLGITVFGSKRGVRERRPAALRLDPPALIVTSLSVKNCDFSIRERQVADPSAQSRRAACRPRFSSIRKNCPGGPDSAAAGTPRGRQAWCRLLGAGVDGREADLDLIAGRPTSPTGFRAAWPAEYP